MASPPSKVVKVADGMDGWRRLVIIFSAEWATTSRTARATQPIGVQDTARRGAGKHVTHNNTRMGSNSTSMGNLQGLQRGTVVDEVTEIYVWRMSTRGRLVDRHLSEVVPGGHQSQL